MALTYGFFDAQLAANGEYDRVYSAENFAEYFSRFVGNGVFPDPATQLQVVSSVPASMAVLVSIGYGWINGYYAHNDANYSLSISVAHASLPRIDAVVLRWVKASRSMEFAVKTGTAAASPTAPTVTRNSDVYELILATIRVNAGVTSITQSAITDKRPDSSVCGWVTGLIDQIDTTNLFAQYNTAFNEWFSNVQAQLSGNVATNLQSQIDDLYKTTPISRGGTGQTTVASALYALINGATALTNTGLATGDYLGIGDVSASAGKKVTLANLVNFLNTGAGLAKVELGSYIGTGTYGADNPNSITFSFAPKLVMMLLYDGTLPNLYNNDYANNGTPFVNMADLTTEYVKGKGLFQADSKGAIKSHGYGKKSSDGKTLYWYSSYLSSYAGSDQAMQLNTSGHTYTWVAIG